MIAEVLMNKVLILNLQTKKSFDDVGGKKAIEKMGVSVAGLYDYSTDKLTLHEEENINSLIEELLSSSLIVGINLKRFSYRVLSAFSENDFNKFASLDILEYLKKKLSFKPTYEGLFNGTLGIKKILRNETYIPRLFKQGKIDEIRAYCEDNIYDLKKLYDFGRKKSHIFYSDNSGQRWKISVNW